MAISVGSVEVDVVPNTRGIYSRLRAGMVGPASQAGREAGDAAGRQFARGMEARAAGVGQRVGEQIGQQIASRITVNVSQSVREGVSRGGRSARPAATRQGDETAGAFSRALRVRLEAAFRALPQLQIGADTSDADSDIQALRVRMATLAGRRIGIDIDAGAALAEIGYLETQLRALGAQHANVQVRADTASALAELAAARAAIEAVDGKTAHVNVDTRGAARAVLHLTALLAGVAAIPAVPVLAAGIGAIGSAAVAAGVGVGALVAVAIPAFSGIKGALDAQKQAQEAATSATARGGQAAVRAAQQALQMQGAQQALAAAERNGARQIAQAQDQVKQAKRAVADAVQQAALRQQRAARAVQDAERSLADAQRDAQRAQDELSDARRQAARDLEDLANRAASARLAQRDAALSLQEAETELARVQADPAAGEHDRARAQLAYDQAVQRLKEQRLETKRLQKEQTAAQKAGVSGSERVLSAQDRLAQAQRTVADRARAVKEAQAEAARVQVETARQVADAQARVGEAIGNVAVAQQSAADAVASAHRQIKAAQLSAAGGANQAAAAQEKYRAALAKLSPAARGTFDAFTSLRSAFTEWSLSLQPDVMPIFTRALNGLKNSLPGLTPFVKAAADAISRLQDRVSRGFKSPWWKSFKKDLAGSVGPAITGLGVSFGRIFKGMAGVVQAFAPHMNSISEHMQRITGRFAKWGTSLKGSPEFENFLDYAAKMGPKVASAIGDIASGFFKIAHALSPLSGPVLTVLGTLARAIGSIAETLPWLVQGIYLAMIAMKLWTIGVALFNAVMAANPITLIVIGIIALVAAVIYAYKHFAWFRKAVQVAWDWIKKASMWAWNNVLKPIFNFIGDIISWLWHTIIKPLFKLWVAQFKVIGAIATWLWKNVLKPVFGFIGDIISWVWDHIIKPIFNGIKWYISKVVAPIFMWLWHNVIERVWNGIKKTISWVWENVIKKTFNALKSAVGKVGDAFGAAKDAIKRAWDRLKDIAKKPVNFVIDTVYNDGIRKVWNTVVGAFGGHKLEKVKKLATGGVLPGYTPGKDVHLAALSGGEAVMRPEWTRAVGAGYVDTMNAAARRGGVRGVQEALGLPGFADGGIFDGIGGLISGAWNKLKKGASWLKDSFGGAIKSGVRRVVNPLIDLIPGDGGFTGLLKSGARDLVDRLLGAGQKGDKLAVPHVEYSPTRGVEQWRSIVLHALRLVGQPAALANTTLRRMQQESGGNPTIVNRWDSNWKAGHPSVGLMQVIRGTFRAYAGRYRNKGPFSYGVSVDPLANIYASMRYAMSRYGSLSKAYNRAGGYDSGGYLQPGWNLAYNGTGRPEPVFTTAQANALTRMAAASPAAGGVGDLTVAVFIGDREITEIARAEVRKSNGELMSVLRAGRRG
ncbi:MAG TPA: transglycosylase SLT domain-containing protein [Streptomyces sp.]|nr:transglycosylase SLT domain-containing protein [Streptomyces sp.]